MRRQIASAFAIGFCAFVACAPAQDVTRDAAASRERAKQVWQSNMTIVDESIDFWKKRSGTSPYTPKELENAIDFFETLTQIHGGNMSFIGPIPDESLEKVRSQWKAWYTTHEAQLTYEASKHRVIVSK